MSFSLRTQAVVGVVLLVLFNIATIGLIWRAESMSIAGATSVETRFAMLKEDVIPLGTHIKSIQIDVIQVQQFLQDISATRGQDGLDGGFEEAAKFAKKFEEDVAAAHAIAVKLGRDDMRDKLDSARRAFVEFHQVGKEMAEAYVAGGPSAGNRMMEEFDMRSEAMSESLEALLTIRDGIIDGTTMAIGEEISAVEKTISDTSTFTSAAATVATLGLIFAAFAFLRFVVRPIGALTAVM
ncbi:MAG: hypothetical protein OEL76_00640, partial [Siculibacillus sp.]|nr:hypothetical protein [Siculibacillus sp.]